MIEIKQKLQYLIKPEKRLTDLARIILKKFGFLTLIYKKSKYR